uniref:Uncharacterized protein n=1 Tax=Molossus molossus TaxID=27622 RepID=A0A7J8C8V5_MOLMO|nr:hypothetical protein HJG59_009914 [Molossus molossus]
MFSLIFLERDRNIDVRKKHPSAQPPLGIKLTTQGITGDEGYAASVTVGVLEDYRIYTTLLWTHLLDLIYSPHQHRLSAMESLYSWADVMYVPGQREAWKQC